MTSVAPPVNARAEQPLRPTRQRALTASEVLFLEVLEIVRRRGWNEFAWDLLADRAAEHVRVLHDWQETADPAFRDMLERGGQVASRAAESLASARLALPKLPHRADHDAVLKRAEAMFDDFAASLADLPDDLSGSIDDHLELHHRSVLAAGTGPVSGAPGRYGLLGLALSGGGVRSASFALGALQAMSRVGLLQAFDYVSSVSGGGWAAGWLAAWSYRHRDGIGGVEAELFESRVRGHPTLRWVRRHIAYLAPRPGIGSNDTWSLLVAYISNWLPILFLVSLAMFSLMLFPHALSASASDVAGSKDHGVRAGVVLLTALALASFMGVLRRLTLFYREPGEKPTAARRLPGVMVVVGAWLATLLLSIALPLLAELVQVHVASGLEHVVAPVQGILAAFAGANDAGALLGWFSAQWWPAFVGLWALTLLLSFTATAVAFALASPLGQGLANRICRAVRDGPPPTGRLKRHPTRTHVHMITALISSLVSAVGLTALLPFAGMGSNQAGALVAFGPFVTMAVFAASELLGQMWVLDDRRDVDRAWAARIGAWVLSGVSAWTLLSVFSLGATALWRDNALQTAAIVVASAFAALVVVAAVMALTRAPHRRSSLYLVIGIAVAVFLLTIALAYLSRDASGKRLDSGVLWCEWAFIISLTLVLARLTNVNRYSLHGLYKQGLVRTFLGASRLALRNPHVHAPAGSSDEQQAQFALRRPDPSTDIDENDNIPLSWLGSHSAHDMPILLLNAAVNGTSATDVEGRTPRQWPFSFSQHFCGSPAHGIGYARTADYYADSGSHGLTLGGAMAVSGAAMSPTAGRATQPLKAFLLGLLNARLGMWIGNPRHPEAVRRASPKLNGFTVLGEMLGRRARFGPFIHLSDGGHFENLGVYELVRRGCRRIVVIDASCDPDRDFAELANAIRRARIDLGVEIHRRNEWQIFGPTSTEQAARAWTWFDIDYGANGPFGRLLYVKPSVYEKQALKVDVKHHWRESRDFPHESSTDQFMSEQQMEAYRSLGETCLLDALRVLRFGSDAAATDAGTEGRLNEQDIDLELSSFLKGRGPDIGPVAPLAPDQTN